MKAHAKFALLYLATCLASAISIRAQLATGLVEYETQTGYLGSVATFGSSGSSATRGEVFTNVSAVTSLTYNFFAGSANSNTSTATTLTVTFGEWNASTSSFASGTTVSFGTITIPASGSTGWTSVLDITGAAYANFSYTFDFTALTSSLIDSTYGYLTSSTKTYALMLTNTTGSVTNLGLGLSNDDTFDYGYAKGNSDYDYVFSQIVVAPGSQNLVATPEASTVAGFLGCTLVAGLVGFRLRQQRKLALVPVTASAA